MASDASLDHQIKTLERRIRDRRLALDASLHELEDTAAVAKQRIRARAASPVLWGGALVLGFVAARLARNLRHKPKRARFEWRREKSQPQPSTSRQVLGGLLSIAMPIAVQVARRQAVPMFERAMRSYARRREESRYRARY